MGEDKRAPALKLSWKLEYLKGLLEAVYAPGAMRGLLLLLQRLWQLRCLQ